MKPALIILAIFVGIASSANLSSQENTPRLTISHITGDFYIYTTYKLLDGKPFPSNSAYVLTNKGAVMFDTPWDTTQFQPLLDSIQHRHNKNVVLCIATHYHNDRTAGLDFLKQKGIRTFSSKLTLDLCKEHHENQAEYYFTHDTTFTIGDRTFQTYYPGEGHTKDNIVLWFADENILYGGCLIKSTESNDLGNIADANLAEWPATIQNVIRRFTKPKYAIPGHFGWADNNGLEHTLQLLQKKKPE